MALLAAFALGALHAFYSLVLFIYSGWKCFTMSSPQPLEATRRRTPKHLAVVLVVDPNSSHEDVENLLVRTIVNLVGWCRTIGTQKLTVYDEHGQLIEHVQRIREIFAKDCSILEHDSSESDIDFPPTPPPSDYSESRPQAIDGWLFNMNTESIHIADKSIPCCCESGYSWCLSPHKSVPQGALTLCFASRKSSKEAIANAACLLASRHSRKSRKPNKYPRNESFKLSVDVLSASLEDDSSLSSPDFLILHSVHTPAELHGFPPWHIRLTEIYHKPFRNAHSKLKWLTSHNYSPAVAPMDELSFRHALDDFAAAEMRFGR